MYGSLRAEAYPGIAERLRRPDETDSNEAESRAGPRST
jgi:hypothetical protein